MKTFCTVVPRIRYQPCWSFLFVSNVLSSFTQTFSPRQKDVRLIPQPKSRRMVYYYKNYNIDEENRWDPALERILSLRSRNKERKSNDDYVQNIQNGAEELVTTKIPDINSPKESKSIIDSNIFILNSDKNDLGLPRTQEASDTGQQSVFPTGFTMERPFQNSAVNTEVVSKKIKVVKTVITDPLACREKIKFIKLRPWNQFYLTCNTPANIKDELVNETYSLNHIKRKKSITSCSDVKSTTVLNRPRLFILDPITNKTRNSANTCSSRTFFCGNQRRISRPRKKRNYFLLLKSHCGVLKSALIRRKKEANKRNYVSDIPPLRTFELISGRIKRADKKIWIPLGKNSFRIKLLPRRNKLKRKSLKLNGNEKISDLMELISWGRRNKNDLEKGIPSCQKSCFYNLTSLVNARTIKPIDYFRHNPTFTLCCEDQVGYTSQLGSSGSTNTSISTNSALPDDLGMSGTSPDVDDSSTDKLTNSDTSSSTTIVSPGTTPTVIRKILQLRNTKKKIIVKHKDKFNLKLLLGNKDESVYSNKEKIEPESIPKPLYYLISNKNNDTFEDNSKIVHMMKVGSVKKIQPWDKFCPCSGDQISTISEDVTGSKRHPWDSACADCKLNKLDDDWHLASTEDPHNSVEVINRPLEEEDIFDDLHKNHSKSNKRKLFLIRVPVAGAQDGRNGSRNFVSHSNDSSSTKHVKPRSILDLFMPSLLKRSTMRPVEHVPQPWEELWKFREDRFNLFTTPNYVTDIPGNVGNEAGATNEPHFVSKSLLEYIAETCPSCSKNRKDSFFRTTDKQYDEFGTKDELCYEDMVSDNSASNELNNENLKCLSDVLKLPEIDLIEISSPLPHQAKSLKGLTILQSLGSPPKYFIEVPEQWTRLRNTAQGASRIPPVSLKKKSKPFPEMLRNTGRKKPIVLCLQPFDINGNSVYLPMSNFDTFDKVEPATPGCATYNVTSDLEEQTSYPGGKSIVDAFIDNSGSVLPFVLVPAYLAMHPHRTTQNLFHDTVHTNATCEDQKPLLCGDIGGVKIIDQEDETVNYLPVENKSHTGYHILYTSPMTVTKHIGLKKKPSRRPSSGKSIPSSRSSYIIFMHGLADDPIANQGDFSLLDEKGAVTIDPIEDFVLI